MPEAEPQRGSGRLRLLRADPRGGGGGAGRGSHRRYRRPHGISGPVGAGGPREAGDAAGRRPAPQGIRGYVTALTGRAHDWQS